MTDSREKPRWEASRALAAGAIAAGTLLALAPVASASMTGAATVLGLPASDFLAGVIVPLAIAAAIFWFAGSQERVDRRFGPTS